MITYQVEDFEDVKHQIAEMAFDHWKEIEHYQDEIKLDIDLETYSSMASSGILKTITVRDNHKLIGYILMLVHKHLHHKEKFAVNDIFYIHPSHRKGYAGIKIFKFAEEVMRAEGVKLMLLSCKTHLDKGNIFKRLGFKPTEISYSKLL